MQGDHYTEQLNASNDYFTSLNKVNLLLLKEHTLNLQKSQFTDELTQVNKMIQFLQNPQLGGAPYAVQAEWAFLQKIIKTNNKEIGQLKSKLQQKQKMLNQLKDLNAIQQKYLKLISLDYQNGIQQKLSMIRGKVDDLKKKIKEINKDVLSMEQQHTQLIDELSFQLATLQGYKKKNEDLRQQIASLKRQKKKA